MANKETRHNEPGMAYRKGISLIELMEMFPNEESAKELITK